MKTDKLTFGRVQPGWAGRECAVYVCGRHEITLFKAEDGADWYTRGTIPSNDNQLSACFTDLSTDGVDLGGTLAEAKAALRRFHFAPEGIDDDDLAQWELEQPGALGSGNR